MRYARYDFTSADTGAMSQDPEVQRVMVQRMKRGLPALPVEPEVARFTTPPLSDASTLILPTTVDNIRGNADQRADDEPSAKRACVAAAE